MPYETRGKCIFRKDTGKKVGCTKGDVKKYLAALQIHEEKEGNNIMDEIERIYIKNSDIRPFQLWMDKNLVYQKNGKLYQDWVDEETGEEETIEVKLSDLYDQFKKRKTGKNMRQVNSENFSLKEIFNNLITEGEAKISKGNKSTKNSFGEDELKTPWATGKKEDCCDEYGISAEDAEKKIKDIKSLDKLDEEYQKLFLQMDNEMDRYWFRRCYQELRNKIGQKEVPKPTVTNKNFE